VLSGLRRDRIFTGVGTVIGGIIGGIGRSVAGDWLGREAFDSAVH
jgi:hypothetical protein